MAAMLVLTWLRRIEAVVVSPLLVAVVASTNVAVVTDAKKSLATVIVYSAAFAEYLESVRVLVTESSMGK